LLVNHVRLKDIYVLNSGLSLTYNAWWDTGFVYFRVYSAI